MALSESIKAWASQLRNLVRVRVLMRIDLEWEVVYDTSFIALSCVRDQQPTMPTIVWLYSSNGSWPLFARACSTLHSIR